MMTTRADSGFAASIYCIQVPKPRPFITMIDDCRAMVGDALHSR
jgi:hypothetical protein